VPWTHAGHTEYPRLSPLWNSCPQSLGGQVVLGCRGEKPPPKLDDLYALRAMPAHHLPRVTTLGFARPRF
jgi:hypothetical protein